MSAAYEQVRRALQNTALDGKLEELNTYLHLTPESPDWTTAALVLIGNQPLQERLSSVERSLQNLPAAMTQTGNTIARSIGKDIADQTIVAVSHNVTPLIERNVAVSHQSLQAIYDQTKNCVDSLLSHADASLKKMEGYKLHVTARLFPIVLGTIICAASIYLTWKPIAQYYISDGYRNGVRQTQAHYHHHR